ncbi:MAG: hypothetical protein EHM56_00215 [Chloroflexi bacterium]|nr:MAG: hypothetical protein EHM56_00215 [Chloroflexota bacterium]
MSAQEGRSLRVSHVAGACRCFPGDPVTFYTRVEVGSQVARFTLRIVLPPGLNLVDYHALPSGSEGGEATQHLLPLVTWDGDENHVAWRVQREPGLPGRYHYEVQATVTPPDPLRPRQALDVELLASRAALLAGADGQEDRDEETATIAVEPRARALKYLPALYQEDDLMGRFLMLFDSFWLPIEGQIDALPFYFDPRLAPAGLLPWLASWIDLVLDERWPEDRRRRLLLSAVSLYRKRGTRQGLEEMLEIYAGCRPEIVEHRAHNFRLGPEARLGPGIALGTANRPHSFTVTLPLPPAAGGEEGRVPGDGDGRHGDQERRRRIEAIVEAEKPAHTTYLLHIGETAAGL